MASKEISKAELNARRLSILEEREANRFKRLRKSHGVYDQKIEDECNKKLRELNCLIAGIPNPDTEPEKFHKYLLGRDYTQEEYDALQAGKKGLNPAEVAARIAEDAKKDAKKEARQIVEEAREDAKAVLEEAKAAVEAMLAEAKAQATTEAQVNKKAVEPAGKGKKEIDPLG